MLFFLFYFSRFSEELQGGVKSSLERIFGYANTKSSFASLRDLQLLILRIHFIKPNYCINGIDFSKIELEISITSLI